MSATSVAQPPENRLEPRLLNENFSHPCCVHGDGPDVKREKMEELAEGAIATLRREITHAMHDERMARLMETAELRSMLEALQSKTSEVPEEPHPSGKTGEQTVEACCEKLAREIEVECENRCAKNAELHARIGREVCTCTKRLEEQRDELETKIAVIQKTLVEQYASLEQAVWREREQRGSESDEFRATLANMWKTIVARPADASPQKQRLFMDESGLQREFTGDSEDVLTLYDLVREALSDSTRLAGEICCERETRSKEIEKVKRMSRRVENRLNTFQALMQGVAGGSRMMPEETPRPARTLAQLAATAPEWNRLINDPDGLFNPDDVIDEAYEKYLGDVIPFMIEHECSFKRGIELSAGNRLADNTSDCELPPIRPKTDNSLAATNGLAELTPGGTTTEIHPGPASCSTSVYAETP